MRLLIRGVDTVEFEGRFKVIVVWWSTFKLIISVLRLLPACYNFTLLVLKCQRYRIDIMFKPASLQKKAIFTNNAPKAVGPYSQAVQIGDTVFVSGCLGLDKQTMKLVEGGAGPETEQALTNLGHVLSAADSHFTNVVKTTVFLDNMDDFTTVNEVYKKFFEDPFPARSCFQVAKLPLGAKVEIEAIAVSGKLKDVK